jgi:phosphoribosyl 1,2-cyclic phosphodiesterase
MGPGRLQDKLTRVLRDASPEDIADDEAIAAYLERSGHGKCYGGNTSCVEVRCGEQTLILDAGSGMRPLADALAADGRLRNGELHILFTHFHWDHICGLPFFVPIYMPEREIGLWSWREAADTERLLALQMADAHFPVKWPMLPSVRTSHQFDLDGDNAIGDVSVRLLELNHPDGAYGYRITYGGRSLCFLTDTEVSQHPERFAERYAAFVEGADLVVVDAMYGFLDYHEHYNYGHSSVFTWIDFFRNADIGELVVFHHAPVATDQDLDRLAESATRYRGLVAPDARWGLSVAYEGQAWSL